MARIPIAEPGASLGTVVARPGGAVRVDPRAFGVGLAQQAERTAGAEIERMEAEQAAEAAEQRRRLAAEEQERRNREREAKRVAAITATARVVNDLGELEDDIAGGLVDGRYAKEEVGELWKSRSGEIVRGGIEGVDPDNRPIVEAQLLDNLGRSRRQITRMVDARNTRDVSQGMAAHLEEMERYAARGGAEADEAIRNVEAFIPSVAGQAGIDAQRTIQGFRERVRFRQAADLVQASPAVALRMLRDKTKLHDLDPDRRGALIAQAEASILRAQERARIEAERIAREQDRFYAGAAAVFESGRAFSAEYAAQVLAQLRGSPYESAVRQMIDAGPQNVAAATLPIEQQRAQIDALLARANTEGSSPAMNREIDRRQKVLAAAERDVRDDPLGAALDRGIVPALPPLNVMDLPSLPAALAQRAGAAQVASTWAGRPVSPLRPQEAEQFAQTLKALPVSQRAAAINLLAQAVPDGQALRTMAGQVAGRDQVLASAMVLAADGNMTTAGRSVTELYLRGAEVIATRELRGENQRETRAATAIRGNIVQAIGDAYFSPQARDLYVDAAIKVQAALMAEGANDSDERAVRLATGGIVTRNGRPTVKPYGWTDREFDDWITKTRDALRTGGGEFIAGGARLTAQELARALPAARMASVGAGQYVLVGPGGQIVRRVDGTPLVLDATP